MQAAECVRMVPLPSVLVLKKTLSAKLGAVGPNPLLRIPLCDSRTHACSLHPPLHSRHLAGRSPRLVNAEDRAFAGGGSCSCSCLPVGRQSRAHDDFSSRFRGGRAPQLSSGQRARPPPEHAARGGSLPLRVISFFFFFEKAQLMSVPACVPF